MHVLTKTRIITLHLSDEVILNLDFHAENVIDCYSFTDLRAPSSPSLFFFLTCMFFLFSLWISGSVFLCSLFIYRYFLCFLSLFLLSVSLVKGKLDPESLGIILLGPFLLEFFPDQVCVCVRVCVCVCAQR